MHMLGSAFSIYVAVKRENNLVQFFSMKYILDRFKNSLAKCIMNQPYNTFVLDRLTKSDGTLKKKGSGVIIFLHKFFENVKILALLKN